MKIVFVGLIIAIVIVAFKTLGSVMAKITPRLGSNVVGQFKNITGNIGWLLAIGGQAFCLILIWQCFPEFFGHWLKTNGFWFIQLGFVVSVILLKYAKPQIVGVIALLLTLICLVVSVVSAGKEMVAPEIAGVSITKSVTEKKWRYGCLKSDKVKGLDPTQRNNLFGAKITYYGGSFHNKARIDFEVYLPQSQVTVYYHSDGTFEQLSPPFQKGNWWLSPVPSTDTNPIFFQGFERYPNGEEVSIWLRAID